MIDDVAQKLANIKTKAVAEFFSLQNDAEIEKWRGEYLWRKGAVSGPFEGIGKL